MRGIWAMLAAGWLASTSLAAAVDASHYRQFWLWAGVRSQPVLGQAEQIYLLQGQIDLHRGQPRFVRQGPLASKLSVPKLWLSYRLQALVWSPQLAQAIRYQLASWRKQGVDVQGIQLDFDAPTFRLADYRQFLQQVRADLPAQYRLGITGLMDWAANAQPEALQQFKPLIDEVVFQTYRGRQSLPDRARYLPGLNRIPLPFKVGLVQHGDWEPDWEARLAQSPQFKGIVVFLLNP